jgi:hypothetical protein
MLRLWPGAFAFLVVAVCYAHGNWRRDRGSPVKAREMVWIMHLIAVISFPALAVPSISASPVMRRSDQREAFLASLALGALPLAIGLCILAALKLVRVYIVRATRPSRSRGT